jgi:hypothetical protein
MSVRLFAAALAVCFISTVARPADNEEFNPYKNTMVGEFATYRLNMKVAGLAIMGTTTQTVTAKTDKEATVKVTGSVNNMEIPAQTQTIDLTKPYDPTRVGGGLPQGVEANVEKGKSGQEKLKILGKEYETTWTSYKVKAKAGGMDVNADVKVWVCKDIPLGMAKMEMNAEIGQAGMQQKMEMTMEVTETGMGKK